MQADKIARPKLVGQMMPEPFRIVEHGSLDFPELESPGQSIK